MRAMSVKAAATWFGSAADTVVLDYDDRHRRRVTMKGTRGVTFLLDLPETASLRNGDALLLEDGRLVEVVAAPELLLEVRGHDPQHLTRLAWHLGNRHVPTQTFAKALRIRRDHVLEDMLRRLDARIVEVEAPFDPEGGAYTTPSARHHHNHHGHDHND